MFLVRAMSTTSDRSAVIVQPYPFYPPLISSLTKYCCDRDSAGSARGSTGAPGHSCSTCQALGVVRRCSHPWPVPVATQMHNNRGTDLKPPCTFKCGLSRLTTVKADLFASMLKISA